MIELSGHGALNVEFISEQEARDLVNVRKGLFQNNPDAKSRFSAPNYYYLGDAEGKSFVVKRQLVVS